MIVGIGLVHFAGGELGVVLGRDALVAKVVGDLVHAVEPADDEPLEIELVGDAQIQRALQLVMVGDKGPGVGAAIDRLQRGRFDLEAAARIEKAPHGRDDARALDKDVAHLVVGQQVEIALSVARLDVAQTVPLLWHRAQGLAQKGPRGHAHGDLAGAGGKQLAGALAKVAEVHLLTKDVVRFLAQHIALQIDLDGPRAIAQVRKGRFAHDADGQEPAAPR